LSYSSSPSYSNASFLSNYHTASSKPTYFTAYLYDSSGNIKDRRIVTVVFDAAATLTITDSIKSTVSGHTTSIGNLQTSIDNIAVGGRNLITKSINYRKATPLVHTSSNGDGYAEHTEMKTAVTL
jgi:hypothetical protein